MKELKIKAEIEFKVFVYEIEELKGKTDTEIAEYLIYDIGNRIHNVDDLHMGYFINAKKYNDTDMALETGSVEILNTSVEEVLEQKFINSLKK